LASLCGGGWSSYKYPINVTGFSGRWQYNLVVWRHWVIVALNIAPVLLRLCHQLITKLT